MELDDSPDELTVKAVLRAAETYEHGGLSVASIHRQGDELVGGLSGAVMRGIATATTDFIAVMDGDGQHPPSVLPAMYHKLMSGGADIVVASRYRPGGGADGLDGSLRQFVSRASTWVAKSLFPIRLRGVTDPMTGCFMMRRDDLDLDKVKSAGFKILLEILLSHPELRRGEVPMRFRTRKAGESKATIRQGMLYLSQLMRLRFASRVERERS